MLTAVCHCGWFAAVGPAGRRYRVLQLHGAQQHVVQQEM